MKRADPFFLQPHRGRAARYARTINVLEDQPIPRGRLLFEMEAGSDINYQEPCYAYNHITHTILDV